MKHSFYLVICGLALSTQAFAQSTGVLAPKKAVDIIADPAQTKSERFLPGVIEESEQTYTGRPAADAKIESDARASCEARGVALGTVVSSVFGSSSNPMSHYRVDRRFGKRQMVLEETNEVWSEQPLCEID